MRKLNYKEIAEYNSEQLEMREGLCTLYESMLQASEGNSDSLELQVMWKRQVGRFKGEEYEYQKLVVMDQCLNSLLNEMIFEFCDNTGITLGTKQNGHKLSMKVSNNVFEREEIEFMFSHFLMSFHEGIITYWSDKLEDFIEIRVPHIKNFEGESLEHSNNKLIRYILDNFRKKVVIKMMDIEKDVIPFMQDGVRFYVKQEIEEVFFNDVTLGGEDENGDQITLNEILEDRTSRIDGTGDEKEYFLLPEGEFIFDKYKEVMTENQLEKFNQILEAIENKEVSIDELFHPVTGEMIIDRIGQILFPNKGNNYHQKAVRQLLNSMRSRMIAALEKEGLSRQVEIRSDYAPFPHLSAHENKLYFEYEIDKKIIKKFEWEDNPIYKNVIAYKDDRFIPQSDIDRIVKNEITVSDLINMYGLTKEEDNKGGYVNQYNLKLRKRGDNLNRVI